MDAQTKSQLTDAGINIDSALARFMGNEKMLTKYLSRFLEEKSYATLLEAVRNDDLEAAKAAAHSLKSVCGTVGCEKMQQQVIVQESAMRAGNWEEAKAMMPELQNTYNTTCSALNLALKK